MLPEVISTGGASWKSNRFVTGLLTATVIRWRVQHITGFDDLMKSAGGLLNSPKRHHRGPGRRVAERQPDQCRFKGLERGRRARAVSVLGRDGGFLNDAGVRIPLPGVLGSAARGCDAAGQGKIRRCPGDDDEPRSRRAVPRPWASSRTR